MTGQQSILQQLVKTKGFKLITFGWIGFITENVLLSHNREYIINEYGSNNYHTTYNILSSISCGSIAIGYFVYGRGKGPKIAEFRSNLSRLTGFIFQSIGIIGFSQLIPELRSPIAFEKNAFQASDNQNTSTAPIDTNIVFKCPMNFKPKEIPDGTIYGIDRVTRHPNLYSLGFVCLGQALHCLYLTEIIMFGFPFIFAVIGSQHIDYRYRRGWGGILSKEKESFTSNFPFVALFEGRQSWEALRQELKWSNAMVSILIALRFAKLRR